MQNSHTFQLLEQSLLSPQWQNDSSNYKPLHRRNTKKPEVKAAACLWRCGIGGAGNQLGGELLSVLNPDVARVLAD